MFNHVHAKVKPLLATDKRTKFPREKCLLDPMQLKRTNLVDK